MTLDPSARRRTFASTFFFKPTTTDFEVYRDPVLHAKHKRSLSERKTGTGLPLQITKHALPTFANDHENKLKEIQNKIRNVQLEIAYYRSKKLFKMEVENTLHLVDLKYKKLKDIDLDLTLLIDKINDAKESKYPLL